MLEIQQKGNMKKSVLSEFNSDNTIRLNIEEIKEKLLTTDFIKEEIKRN